MTGAVCSHIPRVETQIRLLCIHTLGSSFIFYQLLYDDGAKIDEYIECLSKIHILVVTSFIEVMSTGEEELISGKTYTRMSNACVHRTHQVAGSRHVCVMHQLVGSDHRLCHFSKMCRIFPHQRLPQIYCSAK